ncbi:MAG: hypothetical protein DCC65_04785 [Planctomycetota bacterium]|nr:MAG: hypothetical protein DCC65_04785 [Planctomycetota bacterium]
MRNPLRIALVGDFDPTVVAHQAIPRAIALASAADGIPAAIEWIDTQRLGSNGAELLAGHDAVWVVPNSPYRNGEGVIAAIRHVRNTHVPFLGTCGGFQHAVIELARNAAGIASATHAEEHADAAELVVSALACSLVEKSGEVMLAEGSRLRQIYGAARTIEGYHCNYGLNPNYRERLERAGVRFSAVDAAGDVRALEWPDHPFFVATLFQPERAALRGEAPQVVRALLRAACRTGPQGFEP